MIQWEVWKEANGKKCSDNIGNSYVLKKAVVVMQKRLPVWLLLITVSMAIAILFTSCEDSSPKGTDINCWVNYTKDAVVTYDAELLFDTAEHAKAKVEIEIVDETSDYQIIRMSIGNWKELNIPEDRKEIGMFYCANNDVIYKIDEPAEFDNSTQGTIVASPESMETDITHNGSGGIEKSTVTLRGNICVYQYTNGLIETGYYESFVWEKNSGLIEYRSGFGAQAGEIYLVRDEFPE